MRARKRWWCSASATTAFFPLIHDVIIDVCCFFHGGIVGSTRRSASSSLTPVCWQRALSLTETGQKTAVWRWWCCQMILLAVLPRCAFRAGLSHTIGVGHRDGVAEVIFWPQPPSFATQVQRRAPRHILTHSFCKTSNLLNVGSYPDPYTGEP